MYSITQTIGKDGSKMESSRIVDVDFKRTVDVDFKKGKHKIQGTSGGPMVTISFKTEDGNEHTLTLYDNELERLKKEIEREI